MRKAQTSVFIIVGIVLLVIVIMTFYLINQNTIEVEEPGDIRQALTEQVQDCFDMNTENSVDLLGLQGGYLTEPVQVFSTSEFSTAYLYYYGANLLPTIEQMEKNLSYFVEVSLPLCLDLSSYPQAQVELVRPDVEADIVPKKVLFELDWPIMVEVDNQVSELGVFETVVDTDLLGFYNTTQGVLTMTEKNPLFIDQIYLLKHFKNISYHIEDETILYTLREFDDDYVFMFAVGVNRSV